MRNNQENNNQENNHRKGKRNHRETNRNSLNRRAFLKGLVGLAYFSLSGCKVVSQNAKKGSPYDKLNEGELNANKKEPIIIRGNGKISPNVNASSLKERNFSKDKSNKINDANIAGKIIRNEFGSYREILNRCTMICRKNSNETVNFINRVRNNPNISYIKYVKVKNQDEKIQKVKECADERAIDIAFFVDTAIRFLEDIDKGRQQLGTATIFVEYQLEDVRLYGKETVSTKHFKKISQKLSEHFKLYQDRYRQDQLFDKMDKKTVFKISQELLEYAISYLIYKTDQDYVKCGCAIDGGIGPNRYLTLVLNRIKEYSEKNHNILVAEWKGIEEKKRNTSN